LPIGETRLAARHEQKNTIISGLAAYGQRERGVGRKS